MKISVKCQGAPQNPAIFKYFCPPKSAALHLCLFSHYCVNLVHCFPIHPSVHLHSFLWVSIFGFVSSPFLSLLLWPSLPFPVSAQRAPLTFLDNIYYTMFIESYFEYLFRSLLASQDWKLNLEQRPKFYYLHKLSDN